MMLMLWLGGFLVGMGLTGLAWHICLKLEQPHRDARGRFAKRGN